MTNLKKYIVICLLLFPITIIAEPSKNETLTWLNGYINNLTWKTIEKANNNIMFKKGTVISYKRSSNIRFNLKKNILTCTYDTKYGRIKFNGRMEHGDLFEDDYEEELDLSRVVKFGVLKDDMTNKDIYDKKYHIEYSFKTKQGKYVGDYILSTSFYNKEQVERVLNALNHLVNLAGGGKKLEEPF